MKHTTILILVLLLSACTALPSAPPPQTPTAISLNYPPELRPWADLLIGCASAAPGMAIYRNEITAPPLPAHSAEIVLSLGIPAETEAPYFTYAIGEEQIVIIANAQVAQASLSAADLRALFSGRMPLWQNGRPAQIWVYPDESPLQHLLWQTALNGEQPTTQALLAPDPAAMLTAVASNPDAAGFLPQSFLWQADPLTFDSLIVLEIETSLAGQMQLPVLVLTAQEPQGDLYALLACAQAGYTPSLR